MINESLKNYIVTNILPLYDDFDAAHQRNHVDIVMEQSMAIAADLDVDMDMVFTIAAYHDTGLTEDRKTHHLVSGKIVREDRWLRDWFSEEQIETMAQACEDHRASSDHEPRSIYGKIVAEADRFIDPDTIILRTVQYGLATIPSLTRKVIGSAPSTIFMKNTPKAATSVYGLTIAPTQHASTPSVKSSRMRHCYAKSLKISLIPLLTVTNYACLCRQNALYYDLGAGQILKVSTSMPVMIAWGRLPDGPCMKALSSAER